MFILVHFFVKLFLVVFCFGCGGAVGGYSFPKNELNIIWLMVHFLPVIQTSSAMLTASSAFSLAVSGKTQARNCIGANTSATPQAAS